jgi:hypothetical protein
MLLYVFWVSVCLGYMGLSAEPQWQEQHASHSKLPRGAQPQGTVKMADRAADTERA